MRQVWYRGRSSTQNLTAGDFPTLTFGIALCDARDPHPAMCGAAVGLDRVEICRSDPQRLGLLTVMHGVDGVYHELQKALTELGARVDDGRTRPPRQTLLAARLETQTRHGVRWTGTGNPDTAPSGRERRDRHGVRWTGTERQTRCQMDGNGETRTEMGRQTWSQLQFSTSSSIPIFGLNTRTGKGLRITRPGKGGGADSAPPCYLSFYKS